ncbi:helix-turn-helix domain-containing protein [Marilutibacter maris]|uniref:helix-turn-helix domain-containing protein n=1 Tax=Marilutibacter maris TaxID=1605891 RepID=UPI0011AE7D8C|nr:helix-turn-helix domain-containing protein [Lysobacter maris]
MKRGIPSSMPLSPARELLLRRDMPASQIALEAGFAHHSHMMRTLRRVLGEASVAPLRRKSPPEQATAASGADLS